MNTAWYLVKLILRIIHCATLHCAITKPPQLKSELVKFVSCLQTNVKLLKVVLPGLHRRRNEFLLQFSFVQGQAQAAVPDKALQPVLKISHDSQATFGTRNKQMRTLHVNTQYFLCTALLLLKLIKTGRDVFFHQFC